MGFPGGTVKKPPVNAGDRSLDPWVGEIPLD